MNKATFIPYREGRVRLQHPPARWSVQEDVDDESLGVQIQRLIKLVFGVAQVSRLVERGRPYVCATQRCVAGSQPSETNSPSTCTLQGYPLIRKRTLLGPYRRPMPRFLGGS